MARAVVGVERARQRRRRRMLARKEANIVDDYPRTGLIEGNRAVC